MHIKSCPVTIKAAGTQDGTDDGVFEAIVATYDLDSVGDKIMPGAFFDTLAEWKASGNPLPVLWSHMSSDPDYHIGVVEEAEERDGGLWVRARLDLDAPKAAQVYRLLKGRRVTQFSFAYDVLDGGPTKTDGNDEFELRKLKLYEVGPTLIGANQATDLLDVKRAVVLDDVVRQVSDRLAAVKAGRALSAKNEGRVRDAAALLTDVLASLGSSDEDDEKAAPSPPAAVEEPQVAPAAKTVEPARPGPAALRLIPGFDRLALDVEVEAATFTDWRTA